MVRRGELWLIGLHVNPFEKGNINNHDPLRDRKLLMHRKEIRKIVGRLHNTGLTLVPLKLYFRKNMVKVELGLAQGKKSHDKREAIKQRDVERQIRREFSR
jgi:SsrA-binding protein